MESDIQSLFPLQWPPDREMAHQTLKDSSRAAFFSDIFAIEIRKFKIFYAVRHHRCSSKIKDPE